MVRRELFTALVGEVFDKLRYFHYFLSQNLKPIDSRMVLIISAMLVLKSEPTNMDLEKARGEKWVKKALEEGIVRVEAFRGFGIM